MSFQYAKPDICYQITIKYQNTYGLFFRKELDEDYVTNNEMISLPVEKTSVSAFFRDICSGSVTVEAVLSIPLFLYAAISLIWMLEIRTIQIKVRCALQEAGKELAIELVEFPLLNPAVLEEKMIRNIGEERIERSLMDGTIDCKGSYIWQSTGIMELKAEFYVKLPLPDFTIPRMKYEETMRIKMWSGYRKSFLENIIMDEKTVYVTETGIVYHEDYHCNYLEPSVRSIPEDGVESLRNENGGKYYPCLMCGGGSSGDYYVTDYGNRYHSNLSCVGLKRTIYAVPISEVKGKGVCSKCGS